MNNTKIANQFKLLGQLSELLGENPFKVRSYQNAYRVIRSEVIDWMNAEKEQLLEVKGIGKNIADKIIELQKDGKMKAMESRLEQVPEGVVQLLGIKGLGPKKIRALWKELDICSPEELHYACIENRLTLLKGFGEKTQKNVKDKVEFYLKSKNKRRLADVYDLALNILELANRQKLQLEVVGAFRRRCNILDKVEFAFTGRLQALKQLLEENDLRVELTENGLLVKWEENFPMVFYQVEENDFHREILLKTLPEHAWGTDEVPYESEQALFDHLGYRQALPELLDWSEDELSTVLKPNEVLIEVQDIRGLVHCHTSYSDGRNSIEEMAMAAQDAGLEYMVLTDHSQSAFYAGGLKEEDILRQHEEIEAWNDKREDFYIFKSIESDIKPDGSLDYPDGILGKFDLIIASVHAQLNMDEEKATERLIRAIENPHTTILGHPTGRLLLGRKGYPVDMQRVIESCAENGVAIELNSNPWRLDIDWKWIPLCKSLKVPILICPDAHDTAGIKDIRFGIMSARKGGLTAANCWNSLSRNDFQQLITKDRNARLNFINNL